MENETAFRELMQRTVERQAASKKSPVISEEKYFAIRHHLLNPDCKVDPHFRHWVKTRKFQIVNLPGLGLNQVLVIPKEHKDEVDGSAKFLRVIHTGNMYDVVKGIHVDELKHSGYKKVKDYADRHYFGVTRGFVQEYCKHCPVCQLSQPQVTRPPLRPIIQKDFLERVQVDLIDMRHSPDREYNYIGHFMDHFSKFHVLFPLKNKSAEEVAKLLEERVLAYFGPPKLFHSDNGREFVNHLIQALFIRWGGETAFINGRPRHSQSQGLVERGNRTIEKKIAAMKEEEKIDDDAIQYRWASWLPRIQFSMNCAKQETIKDAPYHVVFGKSVPTAIFPGAKGCFAEEDVSDVEDQTNAEAEISQPPTSDCPTKPSSPLPYEDNSLLPASPASPEKQQRHSVIRKKALDNTYVSAAKMSEFYNKRKRVKIQEFSVGDPVSVAVPKLDRTSTDLPRLPAVVRSIHGTKVKTYSLSTAFGVITTKFMGGDLQAYSGDLQTNDEKSISLREAAQKHHPENRFLKAHCSCKGLCKSDKCSCRANGIECSTHCHPKSSCQNREIPDKTSAESKVPPLLSKKDRQDINGTSWMNDQHMKAANELLKIQFPNQSGLQDTVLQQNSSFKVPSGCFVQFIHADNNHWITVSNVGQATSNKVCLYDSLRKRPSPATTSTIAQYMRCREDKLIINVMNVDRQQNTYDCGLFAIAFASSLLFGEDPTELQYDEMLLRAHFGKCIDKGTISQFPARVHYRQHKVLLEMETEIYCECRCPDDGTMMIECELCSEWYHMSCLNLSETLVETWSQCNACKNKQ